MPDNPNSWSSLMESLPPWVGGAIMAFIMATLRVIYEKEETTFTRITIESLICSGLTIAAGSGLEAMGFGQNWYLGCGGLIGFMGTQSVRLIANKFISKKVNK